MTTKTADNSISTVSIQAGEQGGVRAEKMSRRFFGQMLGMPALLASTVTLSACGGGDDGEDPAVVADRATLTRAAFVATVSDYFDWVHSSEYHDPYKSTQQTFVDVRMGVTTYAKQIETALEEAIISNAQGYFYPEQSMTREDAADIYVKAFKIPLTATNALAGFTDAGAITVNKRSSVNAMVAAGYMAGTSATQFAPATPITVGEAKAILKSITTQLVAPPQVMCKSGTTAPAGMCVSPHPRRARRFTTPSPLMARSPPTRPRPQASNTTSRSTACCNS